MIVTVKTPNQSTANFEAMKYGLEIEHFADGTFDLVAHDMDKVNAVVEKCRGKILNILDRTLTGI